MPYLENIDEHTEYTVPLKGGGSFSTATGDMAISPDGTHMAYIDEYYDAAANYRSQKRMLRVIRSSGHALDMSYWSEDWQWIIGWVNNQEIAIATAKKEVVILNPITGNWRTFQQPAWAKPDSKNNRYYYWGWNLPLYYNPTLEWILDTPVYNQLVLKNVQSGKTAWQASGAGGMTWATNSATLAVVSEKTIVVLKDGEQEVKLDTSPFGYGYVSDPKLSPDGQKLAFNTSQNYNDGQVAVFDVAQQRLFKLCADGFRTGWWGGPLWSPDGRFVVESLYATDYRSSFDVLIDTQQLRAYKLNSGDYQHRIAWLAKP